MLFEPLLLQFVDLLLFPFSVSRRSSCDERSNPRDAPHRCEHNSSVLPLALCAQRVIQFVPNTITHFAKIDHSQTVVSHLVTLAHQERQLPSFAGQLG